MKNLEAKQQKMRERNRAAVHVNVGDQNPNADSDDATELNALRGRVKVLETEIADLRNQVAHLSKTSHAPAKTSEQQLREQRHNFFKYSNARRY